MREIKFRGWDKRSGGWFYFELEWFADPTWLKVVWLEVDIDWKSVAQFTGLYDKNGKEIYGGDIVKWGDATAPYIGHIHWNEQTASFAFHERSENVSEGCIPFNKQYLAEIIGNIYENNELLDKEN